MDTSLEREETSLARDVEIMAKSIAEITGLETEEDASEAAFQNFKNLMFKYKENLSLLYSYIRPLTEQLFVSIERLINDANVNFHEKKTVLKTKKTLFRYVEIMVNTYRYKHVFKMFKPDVLVANTILKLIAMYKDEKECESVWRVLMVASVNVFLLPFELERMVEKTYITIYIEMLKMAVMENGRDSSLCCHILAVIFSRKDTNKWIDAHGLVEWMKKVTEKDSIANPNISVGVLRLIYKVLKTIDRTSISLEMWNGVRKQIVDRYEKDNRLVTKYNVKIAYFIVKLSGENNGHPECVNIILDGIWDRDSGNRLVASKYVGLLYRMLGKESQDRIFEYVIANLRESATDRIYSDSDINTKHGCCFLLAELIRNKLIDDNIILERIIPIINDLVVFYTFIGFVSRGSNIRESSCYVIWCMSRIIKHSVMNKINEQFASLVKKLIIMSCTDREIQCRRAAAACFQEIVGRSDNIPHGIDIVSIMNFYSVSVLSKSFNEVLVKICKQYEFYRKDVVVHLTENSVFHKDESIRWEAYCSLLQVMHYYDQEHLETTYFQFLIDQCNLSDISTLQGLLLVGSVIFITFYPMEKEVSPACLSFLHRLDGLVSERLKSVMSASRKTSSDIMFLKGFVVWMRNISMSSATSHLKDYGAYIDYIYDMMEISTMDEFGTSKFDMQKFVSLQNMKPILNRCGEFDPSRLSAFLNKILRFIEDNHNKNKPNKYAFQTRGYIFSISSFPPRYIEQNVENIVDILAMSSTTRDAYLVYVREAAISTLTTVINQLLVSKNIHEPKMDNLLSKYFSVTVKGFSDYSNTFQGDIGVKVRGTTATCIANIIESIAKSDFQCFWKQEMGFISLIGCYLRLCFEKNDSLRKVSGQNLMKIIETVNHRCLSRLTSPCRESISQLNDILFHGDVIDWNSSKSVYCYLICVLGMRSFIKPVLVGIVKSVGSLNESLSLESLHSLIRFTKDTQDLYIRNSIVNFVLENMNSIKKPSNAILTIFNNFLRKGVIMYQHEDVLKEIMEKLNTYVIVESTFSRLRLIVEALINIYSVDTQNLRSLAKNSLSHALDNSLKHPKVIQFLFEQIYMLILKTSIEDPDVAEKSVILIVEEESVDRKIQFLHEVNFL